MIEVTLVFFALNLLLWLLHVPVVILQYVRVPKLTRSTYPTPAAGTAPLVSVVIPARNEEKRIEGCLEAVLASTFPNLEVVVVDDRSSDRTAEIAERIAARDGRVRVVRGAECPDGWAGKNHAIVQGVAVARGEWLLMLDADVRVAPECVAQAMGLALEKEADLFTLAMTAVHEGFWERLLQPFLYWLMLAAFPLDQVNDPRYPKKAMAPGPFLLFRRSSYERLGGHGAMKGEIVEDLALARRVKLTGHRLVFAMAPGLATLAREVNFRRLWEGWSRVTFKGLESRYGLAAIGVVAILACLVAPWFLPPAAAAWMAVHGGSVPAALFLTIGLATVLCFLATRALLRAFYGLDSSLAWLQPLAALVFVAILANSARVAAGGGEVRWKGRAYGKGH